jgi:hypothetical protein
MLGHFLSEAAQTPFGWGGHDCCLFPANWVLVKRGVDPARAIRGSYRTQIGALKALKAGGGITTIAERGLCDFAHTDAPIADDVGLIWAETPVGEQLVGAICTGHRWAFLGIHGLIVAPARHARAWRI